VEITTLFEGEQAREIRLESVCVAGGPATVTVAPAPEGRR
jgi:hypothetical protein